MSSIKTRVPGSVWALSALGLVVGTLAGNAMAESPPGSIPVGPMFVYPELEIATKHDSNIALVPDDQRKSDTIWYLRPTIRLEAKQGVNVYDLTYRGEFGRYNSQKNFDFNNNDLDGRANLTLNARNNLKLGARYEDKVDPPGTLNIAATPTPNHYRVPTYSGLYTYGAEDAKGKLELLGDYSQKRYVNNRDVTAQLDLDTVDYGGTFLWRVMPKTYATFALKQSVFDYKEQSVTLDSDNTYALIGLRWEATAATSGKIQLGNWSKKFEDAGRQAGRTDKSAFGWDAAINWKPLRYSSIDFITRSAPVESTGLGNYTINDAYQVLWTHAWTSQFSSELGGSYMTDKFDAAPVATAGGSDRKDTTKSAGLNLTYSMKRWLKLGAEYLYDTRDSNDNNFDYTRNRIMFFVSGTL